MEEYYQKWYEQKKETICAKKREQYHSNAELRERKRQQALARYHRLKMDSKGAEDTFSNLKVAAHV